MRIVATILFLLMFPVLLESCGGNCDCCDQTFDKKEFAITDMFLSISAAGVSGSQVVPHSISPKSLIFNFSMSVAYSYQSEGYKPTMAAYACVLAPPSSKQKFLALKITSDKQLVTNNNQTFAPNQDLSGLFLLTDFILNDVMHSSEFHFTPVFGVSEKAEHNLKFSFTLDDGRTFELQSGLYEFLP